MGKSSPVGDFINTTGEFLLFNDRRVSLA